MKKALSVCAVLAVPAVVIIGAAAFQDRYYSLISVLAAVLTCVPFFLSFERGSRPTRRIVMLAVMVALSVAGRFVFAPIPFFKPVTAMVIISALFFGSEFGFLTGALSALVSNMYFGQGPWTPFQMFAWGLIGFIAGLMSDPLKRSRILLAVYSAISGVVFSLIMDVWTTLWADGSFNLSRFTASVVSSLPIMLIYIVSNTIFVLALFPLFNKKIERLKLKYGI